MTIKIRLPSPWPVGSSFDFDETQQLTWIVGPNGTGKSRFLRALRDEPNLAPLKPRLVSTDRLSGVRRDEVSRNMFGDTLANGLNKTWFDSLIGGYRREGTIAGTVALLHRRPDLRIRVEATLSQLLDRHIRLEMTDGALVPRVRLGSRTDYYGMFADECHGVLELLALLASIYDDESPMLLIDEPELHLHPQYQGFILEELRKSHKKAVLATHSPSFLSLKNLDDLRGVICFHPDFRIPSRYRGDATADREVQEILPRMTEQHRAFFFARTPVFVEGYFDSAVISCMQRGLGESAEAAGSCIIPSMGKEEAGRFLILCNALGKRAAFVFDLDALFDRRLRIGAAQRPDLAERIAADGHGEYEKLVGQVQRALTAAVQEFAEFDCSRLPPSLAPLRAYLDENPGPDNLDKRRVAVLVSIAEQPTDVRTVLGWAADTLSGYLHAVIGHLERADIHVLPGGALENYLPSYTGNRFSVPDGVKREVAASEQMWLSTSPGVGAIEARYGALARVVRKLPSRPAVDLHPVLRRELSNLLHEAIIGIRAGSIRTPSDVPATLGDNWKRVANFVEVTKLTVVEGDADRSSPTLLSRPPPKSFVR